MEKLSRFLSKAVSVTFHPLLVPTWSFLLMFYSGFYFAMLGWGIKRFILLTVFFTTCVLPLMTILLLSMSSRFNREMEKSTDRVLPLMFTSVYAYLGYYLLGRLPVFPVYKVFLLCVVLLSLLLMIISLRWKISNHMAALGGLTGLFLALSFRLQMNTSSFLMLIILIAGLVGSSRLFLKKHDVLQVTAGYFVGFATMFLIILFV